MTERGRPPQEGEVAERQDIRGLLVSRIGLVLWLVGSLALLAVGAGVLAIVEPRVRVWLLAGGCAAWAVGTVIRVRWRRPG